jgi:cell division protein FtsW
MTGARPAPGRGQLEARLLLLVTLGLVAFGLVMVYSATSAPAALGNGDPGYYLKRQLVYAMLGLLLMVVLARVDFRALRRFAPTLVVSSLVLLVGVLALGQAVNGARRWLAVGPLVFQPSELAKVALAVWAAAYLTRRPPPQRLQELWRPVGILLGVFGLLLLAEPDLGTAIAVVIMLTGVLFIAGTPPRALAGGLTIVSALALAAIWLEPYRRARIFSFLDPWHDAQGAGFQVVQAMIGLGSGGIFGVGLGQSVQKVNYLPEAHTDMIFAIIGEELGLVGAVAVIAAYATFAYAGLRVALRCRDPFGKRLAAGLTLLVCGQAGLNLAAVMGLAPLTGIPLPFVSYGGSSLVAMLACVGVLLNIAVDHAGSAARVSDRSRGDGRPRAAVARGRGGVARARRAGDVRRVARSNRSAARS